MDSTGRDRWQSKVEQHRKMRREQLSRDTSPKAIFERMASNLGDSLDQWIGIFQDSWKRESPTSPGIVAKHEKEHIKTFILSEEKLITEELAASYNIHDKDVPASRVDLFQVGAKQLRTTCDVYTHKCIEAIENMRAVREGELQREKLQAREKTLERLYGAGIALVAAFAAAAFTAWFSRDDVKMYKDELDAFRSEIKGLRSADENTSSELKSLREDYRRLVLLTFRSPKQIDLEIAQLKDNSEQRKKKIRDEYQAKRNDVLRDMGSRNLLGSPMQKNEIKRLEREEADVILSADKEMQRSIEDLQEQKSRLPQ